MSLIITTFQSMHDRETEERTLLAAERTRVWECLAGAFTETVWDKDLSDTLAMCAQFRLSGDQEARARCENRVVTKTMTRQAFMDLMAAYIEADDEAHADDSFFANMDDDDDDEISTADLDDASEILSESAIEDKKNRKKSEQTYCGSSLEHLRGMLHFQKVNRPPVSKILLQRLTRIYSVLEHARQVTNLVLDAFKYDSILKVLCEVCHP